MSEGTTQMNGPSSPTGRYIDTVDPDDPEYQKQMRRPADIKEDMHQMGDRSRVSLILNSEAFRRELEEIVDEQLKTGHHPASLLALQQISELILPRSSVSQSTFGRGCPAIPISDIRGAESLNYSKAEKVLRCKLASCYRLVDMFGWTHGIYNHISARVNMEQEHFLLNPFGLMYSEVTSSSLVKVDMQGEIVDPGSTLLGINKAGYTLHSAVHQARPDIRCVIHLHTPAAVAVSVMKCGFLPLSQESLICGGVSYHDYNGILIDQEERDLLQRNLGPTNKIMFLRNHGVVACGSTIEEAFHYAFNVMSACEAQVRAIPVGLDNIVLASEEAKQKTYSIGNRGGGGVDTAGRKWRTGELEYEALMRQLDNAGYRTGYVFHCPVVKQERKDRSGSEVEIPPASSSFTYVFDGDIEHSKFVSPLKSAMEKQKQMRKATWLNSPNAYIKTEIEETGTDNPKKITKWVPTGAEDSPTRTSIKVESPNVFAPQGENPKEYREKQKQIKKEYYDDIITPGPQSKILEGVTWDEANQKMKDGNLSATGDSVIVMGAASKGIIQRGHQHNVQVYKSQYAANPFENVDPNDIDSYKMEVERKAMGEPAEAELEPGPDGNLISSEERVTVIQQHRISDSAPEPKTTTEEKLIEDEEKAHSPAKSDTLKSTDSASGGDTLDDRSSKEGSPTKELPSPTKDKKKKKKFRMPSFSKAKKNKESKESAI